MFLPGWSIWCVLLTLCVSACALEISGYDSDEVICSQGLSDCTMMDEMPLTVAHDDAVDVKNLTPHFKLCCKDRAPCTLCLVIDTEIIIHPDKTVEDEDHSGLDEEDYSEETRNPKVSVTVCYNTASTMPTCKKVEFTVNHTALTQQNHAKLSMVINPARVFYSSRVLFSSRLHREVVSPSLDEVCKQELWEHVADCEVPGLRSVINHEMNRVELQFADSNESLPSVCAQYEENGRCRRLNRMTIPLYSVTPCMCFQAWFDDDQISTRSPSCPFVNTGDKTDFIQRNVWQNVSVSVVQGHVNNNSSMLWWNLSAPCRLQGEVWPCHKDISCREMKGFRLQLANDRWSQNSKDQWEQRGVFEDINPQLSPCVMVKIKGMVHELGPFCFNNTDRCRWSLLIVGVLLLVCLTVLIFCLLRDFVKKWVWSWHHGGFVEIGGKPHVVLLSPPDVDTGVSESVCRLGSLLCNQGFSVSVDQWSRKEQCTLGPLPWLHSQLLEVNSQGGRVVLVLTRKALERAEEWTHQQKKVISIKGEDKGLPQIGSPYSDVFMASLCLIQANKQLGRAGERFLLVTFDYHPHSDRSLPELLQGLLLFQLPSQTQPLLTELTVGRTGRGSNRRTWTRWRAKAKEEPDQQKTSCCKYVGAEKNFETVKPLRHPC